MLKTSSFTIYNASAGSGKTYTLVKEYLKLLFQSDNLFHFKRILAITFTNKAVTEMKERIINTLRLFSEDDVLESSNSMFETISSELQIQPERLQKKSKQLLQTIIHNYASFDISTIDGFTHKLIRTFAHDLKLPLNFEVELDQDTLLNEAVESLIAKTGTNKILTKTLVEFALEKADDDKSWDISYDFNKIAKLLITENDKPFIESLKHKTPEDFERLKKQLTQEINDTEAIITKIGKDVIALIKNSGLEFSDFSGGYLPKYFDKLASSNFKVSYDSNWQKDLENKTLYPKRVSRDIASVIEALQPQIAKAFHCSKTSIFQLKFLKAFYKNITPLSVLNAINNELTLLKEDQNKMLISEFNTIISEEIKEQPTPFIYERIGEKFKHYFIDEFQDTSIMQWTNLIPLLNNAVSTEGGSTMLVGDAKQAIYRWRGGKAEQFIDLFNKTTSPFQIEQSVENLQENYRSFKEIVSFNNGFFKYLGAHFFENSTHQTLYEQAVQNSTQDHTGYVELSFLTPNKDDDRNALFSEVTLDKIYDCLNNGFHYEDICILVRKKKDGIATANYLSLNNVPIISSDTLLLTSAPEVNFINDLLSLLNQPTNNEIKIRILNYLSTSLKLDDKHAFFSKHITLNLSDFFKSLEAYNIKISSQNLLQLPLYDLAETIVRSFNLVSSSNAFVQFYLDVILDFSEKKGSDLSGFLEYFDKKKDTLSITSPKGQNAVQIMTIHKSKGLEFPVVIFPFADLDIYKELEAKSWFKIDDSKYSGFTHTLLNYNKDFEFFGEEGNYIYHKHKAELELDNINLLYVALTRAVEHLYIISSKDMSSKGDVNSKKYSGLLINYLQQIGIWNANELVYSFGTPQNSSRGCLEQSATPLEPSFISTAKEEHNIKVVTKSGYLWNTNQQEAIEKGNLIHDILGQIITADDIDLVANEFLVSNKINLEQSIALKELVLSITNHPKLKKYFSGKDIETHNERDIISTDGIILRPDRVSINSKNEATIIDYKTGLEDKKHEQQLKSYEDALEDMNIIVEKKILVYINNDIKVKDV
ncbi:UvrD-helicase domain-containing protein [Cognatitamlana onchidii]|uniref:UvrD-helicase domain-containing protein n=1 Tax=Cognatitamlana onchidii TaxID=2562860 RepID=UPI0010A6A85F|nr:UvrD-helicase domain-containing protein [Algibacter onchidii]